MMEWPYRGLLTSLFAVLGLATTVSFSQAPSLHLTDVEGHSVQKLAGAKTRAVVLLFSATDCPISGRYIPEFARLDKEFGTQGVAFWWVYPNPGDTAAVVRKHESAYSIHANTVIDNKQELVQMAHVDVTPEAAVFAVSNGTLREAYHGRIDDLYYSFGKARPAATHHDLEDAIRAVLGGRPVMAAAHGPIGCSIVPLSMGNAAKP